MIFLVIYRKIKSLICCFFAILKKCFCCFKRKCHEEELLLPITIKTHNGKSIEDKDSFEKWDSWEGPSSVTSKCLSATEQQIHQYRIEQQQKLCNQAEEPNYFEDLAPKIKQKPQVVILARPEEEQYLSNRLSLSLTEPHLEGSELLEWNDNDEGGWEEEAEDDLDVDAAIREQKVKIRQAKKKERLKKKEQKEMDKQSNRISGQKLAMKLS